MAINVRRDSGEKTEIPTASMADIAFLLIVFFMLTSAFSSTKGVDFRLPDDNQEIQASEPDEAIYVHSFGKGGLEVDKQNMGLDEMASYIYQKLRSNPQKAVLVHIEADAEYKDLIEVYDELMKIQETLKQQFKDDGSLKGGREWGGMNISIPSHREIEIMKQLRPDLF